MAATFSSILPQLQTVMLAGISIDGGSGRTLKVPLDYPSVLDSATLPCFINRLQAWTELTPQTNGSRRYNVTIRSTLYLEKAAQGIPLSSNYDTLGYLDQITDLFMTNPRLSVNNLALDGVRSNIVLSNGSAVPDQFPYPEDSPDYFYWGMRFNLSFEFAKYC